MYIAWTTHSMLLGHGRFCKALLSGEDFADATVIHQQSCSVFEVLASGLQTVEYLLGA